MLRHDTHTYLLGVEFALNGEEVRVKGREVVGDVRVVEVEEGNTATVEVEEDIHLQTVC